MTRRPRARGGFKGYHSAEFDRRTTPRGDAVLADHASRTALLLGLLALASGALIPVQAASNAALSRSIQGNVPFAALLLFVVAGVATALLLVATGKGMPQSAALSDAPWWSYSGGFIVAFYVLTITYLAPRLGVGTAISLIVAGQILSALAIDHFGLMRSLTVSLTPTRALGAILMIVGVFLALRR
jgi:transporter family-2 protein